MPRFLQSPSPLSPLMSPPSPSPPPRNFIFNPTLTEFLYLVIAAVMIYSCCIISCFRTFNRQTTDQTETETEDPNPNATNSAALQKLEAMKKLLPILHIDAKNQKEEAENRGGDTECAICLDEFESGDEIRALPVCGHRFHAYCVDYWFVEKYSCPICRSGVIEIRDQ